MANLPPFFVTGSNCKIKVNGVTLAYARDLSYSVSIPHKEIKTLGAYEVHSLEPTSYSVRGSFTVIRYSEGTRKKLLENAPSDSSNKGNGIGYWKPETLEERSSRGGIGIDLVNGRANDSLDPSELHNAITFDIEVWQTQKDFSANEIVSSGLTKIRNCRIVDVQSSIPKGLMTQTFQFVAQYLDEDSFIANSSDGGKLNA
jgi:hypothetical protein